MSSNVDIGLVYRPPNSLQFPKGMEPKPKADSRAGSPNSSSSSQSDLSFSPTLKTGTQFEFHDNETNAEFPSIAAEKQESATGSFENESDSTSPSQIFKTTKEDTPADVDKRSTGRFSKTPVSI